MTQQAPSTSSSFFYGWTYDVFLNFRGKDTRNGFTGNLYNALRHRGIRSFIDDEGLRRGEEITPSLLKAIEDSRIAIVVFSENYASSSFCLEELAKILECVNGKGRWVWPVFYGVDPSKVRDQSGSYGEALDKYQNKQKVEEWRLALTRAANLSGWHFKQGNEYEYVFIEKIIEEVSKKIRWVPLHIANYPVGLEHRIQELIKLLGVGFDDEKVNMVGIYGTGGIGKTTIACAVYNSIADQFEALCFLTDIRVKSKNKNGLASLQKRILLEMIGEHIKLGDAKQGIPIIKRRLNQKKILLILDDVDNLQQLQALAGGRDWFGFGSKVIITTRDTHILRAHGVVKLYGVKELNNEEALELFSWNAFKSNEIDPCYVSLSNLAISYASGLPLALQAIGSDLFGKSLEEMKSALYKYENKSVHEILKVSYDGLEDKEKEIFLDIACFFRGDGLKYVTNMLLHSRGFDPKYSIGVLIQKSLLMLEYDRVSMHSLIEEMGKEIVKQESKGESGYRSRLWFYEDILHVLEEDTGTEKIEIIMLDLPEDEEVCWTGEEFKKMKNLKILKIINAQFSTGPKYLPNNLRVLDWSGYPSPTLPSDFHPRKLGILSLPNSRFILEKPLKNFKSLSHMNFRGCESLIQLPDLSGVPNLTELCLDGCANLIELHDSIGFLHKLRKLSARNCTRLSNFPRGIHFASLERLYLWGCSSLKNFPAEILEEREDLSIVCYDHNGLKDWPCSIERLTFRSFCDQRLFALPIRTFMLPKLESLEAQSCRGCQKFINCESQENTTFILSSKVKEIRLNASNFSDEFVHYCITLFPNIESIWLLNDDFTILPLSIKEFRFVTTLKLDCCRKLRQIVALPPNIKYFSAINCISLTSESTSLVLSEEIHKVGGTNFLLPGTKIPDWFDHLNKGASMSFWFRKKFPSIAVCFALGGLNKVFRRIHLKFRVFINGKPSCYFEYGLGFQTQTDHVFLFDLQQKVKLPPNQLDQVIFENEWNHVEVHCLDGPNDLEPSINKLALVKWSGVYVFKQGNHMDDVLFSSTIPQNRTYDDVVNLYPWIKEQRTFTDDTTSESSAMVNVVNCFQLHRYV